MLNVKFFDKVTNVESYCQVLVKVNDINDNQPDFFTSFAMVSVKEDFELYKDLYVAKAVDPDDGLNGQVQYAINDNPGNIFKINPSTGSVQLTKALDFEESQKHVLNIRATDSGNPALSNDLKLQILVHDVNDNSPVFQEQNMNIHVSGDHLAHTPIATANAHDLDEGRNGRISYFLEENPYIGVLQNSGVLILKKSIDFRGERKFNLKITARDHGQPTRESETMVHVTISGPSGNPQIFSRQQYEFSIAENKPVGTLVGSISTSANGNLEYSFKLPNEHFHLGKTSGKITTAKLLDREEIPRHNLIVQAVQKGASLTSGAQTLVVVSVKDENDNPPMLVEPVDRVFYVPDQPLPGSVIGRVIFKDPDDNERSGLFSFQIQGKINK